MKKWDMSSRFGKGTLLTLIRDHPGITIRELREQTGDISVSGTILYRNVGQLIDSGYVMRDYSPRGEFTSVSMKVELHITEEGMDKLAEYE